MNANDIARAACGMHIAPPHREAPKCPAGMHEFDYKIGGVSLTCHMEYEPAERGSRENGVPMEPDYDEYATVCRAYVRDIDVYDLLTDKAKEQIEIAFLEQGESE